MKFKRNNDGTEVDSWVVRVVGDLAYVHDSQGDTSFVCHVDDVDASLAQYYSA